MASDGKTFAIKHSRWVRPLLWIVGSTASRSYASLEDDHLHARFGYYALDVPLDRITNVEHASWPWWGGIGVRTNLKDSITLNGSTDNIVRIDINPPVKASVLKVPINMTSLYLSLEEPDRFLEAVRSCYPAAVK